MKNTFAFSIVVLLIIECLLFITNYDTGTFLSGWDNIHTELNVAENVKRSWFGVWQEHRGLGLYDGLSHTASLLHGIYIWILHFILPQNLIRWVFIFIAHLSGVLGVYLLLRHLLVHSSGQIHHNRSEALPLLGSLWYGLNIGTVQMFQVPLDAFAIHFAALPWIAFSILRYLENATRKNYVYFLIICLLSSSQFFIPTLILPVAILIICLIGTKILYFFTSKYEGRTQIVRSALLVVLGFFFINAFWLFPFLYGLPDNAAIITNSKINQMSTDEIFERNQARGGLVNTLFHLGINYDFTEILLDGSTGRIMQPWHNHIAEAPSVLIFAFLTLSIIFGLWYMFRYRLSDSHPLYYGLFTFGVLYSISLIFLGNDIPIIAKIMQILQSIIPLFKEAYRYPFTKFIHLAVLSSSVLLTFGLLILTKKLPMKFLKNLNLFHILLVVLFLTLSKPAFEGQFVNPIMKVNLPAEYSELFSYLQNIDSSRRIVTLPQQQYWSWIYYRFGYRGSGFQWYGFPQPVMDRAFDPWNKYNENFYWELTYAMFSKNAQLFENVLRKYDISYILVDDNVITPNNSRPLYTYETNIILQSMPLIRERAQFGNIKIYEFLEPKADSFVNILADPPVVHPIYKWTDNDEAFSQLGNYISSPASTNIADKFTESFEYSFRSLFTKRSSLEREFSVSDIGHSLVLGSQSGHHTFTVDKNELLRSDTNNNGALITENVSECGILQKGSSKASEINEDRSYLRLTAKNQRTCFSYNIPDLLHSEGYLVEINTRNIKGNPLLLTIVNQTAEHVEVESHLTPSNANPSATWQTDYIILPPLADDGLGYTISLLNSSISNTESINDISRIQFFTIPYREINQKNINTKYQNRFSELSDSSTLIDVVGFNDSMILTNPKATTHKSPEKYIIKLQRPIQEIKNEILYLSQAYHNGWKTYIISDNALAEMFPFFLGQEVTEHVMVNNWANGWILPENINENSRIVIYFLPQLLQWVGFLFLFVPFFFLWRHKS